MSEFGVLSESGQRIDVLDPSPDQVVIGDVIRALSVERRFPATGFRYSVAQHSVVVGRLVAGWLELNPAPWTRQYGANIDQANEAIREDIAKIRTGAIASHRHNRTALLVHRAAVLHDASEYVLRDMARDVKRALRKLDGGYDVLEANLMNAVSKTMGLESLWRSTMSEAAQNIVKRADDEALAAEVSVLWPENLREHFHTADPAHYSVTLVREAVAWTPEEAQRAMALELLESAFDTWGHCSRIGTTWPTF